MQAGYPAPQGPFYCGVGAESVYGRPLAEDHMEKCIEVRHRAVHLAACNFAGAAYSLGNLCCRQRAMALLPSVSTMQPSQCRWLVFLADEANGLLGPGGCRHNPMLCTLVALFAFCPDQLAG